MRTRLLVLALLATACRPRPAPAPPRPDAVSAADVQASGLARTWTLGAFAADLNVAEDQQLQDLDRAALTTRLQQAIATLPQLQGQGELAERVGVQIVVGWQALDAHGAAAPILAPKGDGTLFVSVSAHAERLGVKPRDLAERTVEAPLPFPADHAGTKADFVFGRIRQAASLATTDALGELWARRLTDAEVQGLLGHGPLWQQMAGAREVGERHLKDSRLALEKAARDSRKDLAAVAAAALGRLRDDRSTAVLVSLLDGPHLEVADAALGALSDIGSPASLAALREAADKHEVAVMRQRARALLEQK